MKTPQKKTLLYKLIIYLSPKVKKLLKKILYIPKNQTDNEFSTQVFIFFVVLVLGIRFLAKAPSPEDPYGASDSFLHNINLVFHEAGHILFIPFGEFLTILGGSLFQCLVPFICMYYFLIKSNNFSASITFWWFGQNLMDIAPYIYDAKALYLPLLTGAQGEAKKLSHDWYLLLTKMDILDQYSNLALFVNNLGRLCLVLSLIWSAYLLFKTNKLLAKK
ncbi:MAG: zinc ribbon domain-containing protein [Bdellovibrionales bacterium]|nr:zinc ribbon domain-containing protein [Bdellovibrionales bacterium]